MRVRGEVEMRRGERSERGSNEELRQRKKGERGVRERTRYSVNDCESERVKE